MDAKNSCSLRPDEDAVVHVAVEAAVLPSSGLDGELVHVSVVPSCDRTVAMCRCCDGEPVAPRPDVDRGSRGVERH
jgi:hypothetical protein